MAPDSPFVSVALLAADTLTNRAPFIPWTCRGCTQNRQPDRHAQRRLSLQAHNCRVRCGRDQANLLLQCALGQAICGEASSRGGEGAANETLAVESHKAGSDNRQPAFLTSAVETNRSASVEKRCHQLFVSTPQNWPIRHPIITNTPDHFRAWNLALGVEIAVCHSLCGRRFGSLHIAVTMGKKGHVRARTAKAKKLNSNKKRMLYGAPVARKPTSLVVATAGAGGTTAHAEAEASSAFALHSVLLGSNPNAARVGGYTNTQDILLVGEGDFSYALAIAVALVRMPGTAVTVLGRGSTPYAHDSPPMCAGWKATDCDVLRRKAGAVQQV